MYQSKQWQHGMGGSHNQQFVAQDIYGCGPQSVPILDPRLILAYQKALFKLQPDLFHKTLGLLPQMSPEHYDDVVNF